MIHLINIWLPLTVSDYFSYWLRNLQKHVWAVLLHSVVTDNIWHFIRAIKLLVHLLHSIRWIQQHHWRTLYWKLFHFDIVHWHSHAIYNTLYAEWMAKPYPVITRPTFSTAGTVDKVHSVIRKLTVWSVLLVVLRFKICISPLLTNYMHANNQYTRGS